MSTSERGRLEVYYNESWTTVCADSFGPEVATVACRQLGYGSYSEFDTVTAIGYVILVLSTSFCGFMHLNIFIFELIQNFLFF